MRRSCTGKHCIERRAAVLVLWWVPGSLLDRADVIACYEGVRALSEGYLLPLVVYLQGLAGITPEARAILLEGSLSSRIGVVGAGPVDQVIAAFMEQAMCETRYFEQPGDALAWALDAPG
jgi:hypothetical protein